MRHSAFFSRFLLKRSLWVLAALAAVSTYAVLNTNAHINGISDVTEKPGSANGCTCHCANPSGSTIVTVTTAATSFDPGTPYTFTATVANAGEIAGGIDIATYSGSGLSAIGGQGLYLLGNDLTHSAPKTFAAGSCSWTFTYTTGTTTGYDTIYATGNAVNGDGTNGFGNCSDNWNNAAKYVIHVVGAPVLTKRLALGRNAVSLGQLRVGRHKADSLLVSSNGQQAITINASSMKSGAPFSTYPTSSGRSINNGSTEMDSVIFQPTSRGTFSDSLIFTTNSDTVLQQRLAVYVSGQGIQAVFNGVNGTSLAFGNLRINRTTHLSFIYRNTGDDTLFLQTPAISGAGYTIMSGPSHLTLVPNQTDSVIVQFAPTAGQVYNGTLNFTASNGVTIPAVPLSGTGTTPPQIQVSATASLGTSRVNQTLQGSVQIHDAGSDTLHISNVSITQSGTKFTLGSYDAIVLAAGSGAIHVNYVPNQERTDSATLHFSTDDPTDTSVTVLITASGVLPHMSVADHDTVNMGDVKVGTHTSRDFTINNTGSDNLTIRSVSVFPTPPYSLVSAPQTIVAGSSGHATIQFGPVATGTFHGTIIVTGDDPSVPYDTINVRGAGINSSLSVPANVDFGSVPTGSPVTQSVVLANSGGVSVRVLSYTLTQGAHVFALVDTVASVASNDSGTVTVRFTPTAASAYTATLVLTTDDVSTPTRTINITGRGIAGRLAWSQSSLNFSAVDTGKDSTLHIWLHNTGNAAATVSSLTITGSSAFSHSVVTTPATIAPGDSTAVDVTFAPTALGSQSATLNAVLSDQSMVQLALAGTGIVHGVGHLSWSPESLDFSNIDTGKSATLHVSLHNIGAASISVNSFTMTGSSAYTHSAITTPAVIAPGDSISIDITFAPIDLGSQEAMLNAVLGDQSLVQLVLAGSGVAPQSGVATIPAASSDFGITLSPNPAKDITTIYLHSTQVAIVRTQVFDALGREVTRIAPSTLSGKALQFDLATNGLTNGNYFVRVTGSNGEVAEGKLIIAR
jgi:hypothetical protein